MRCHSSGRARATACLRPSPSVSAWLRTRWFKKIAAVRGNQHGCLVPFVLGMLHNVAAHRSRCRLPG